MSRYTNAVSVYQYSVGVAFKLVLLWRLLRAMSQIPS